MVAKVTIWDAAVAISLVATAAPTGLQLLAQNVQLPAGGFGGWASWPVYCPSVTQYEERGMPGELFSGQQQQRHTSIPQGEAAATVDSSSTHLDMPLVLAARRTLLKLCRRYSSGLVTSCGARCSSCMQTCPMHNSRAKSDPTPYCGGVGREEARYPCVAVRTELARVPHTPGSSKPTQEAHLPLCAPQPKVAHNGGPQQPGRAHRG